MADVAVRRFEPGDGVGISRIGIENGAYYARIAPEHFRKPDEEGFAELIEEDSDWRESENNLALVAEVDGEVAGYLGQAFSRRSRPPGGRGNGISATRASSSTS